MFITFILIKYIFQYVALFLFLSRVWGICDFVSGEWIFHVFYADVFDPRF